MSVILFMSAANLENIFKGLAYIVAKSIAKSKGKVKQYLYRPPGG